MSRVLVTGASGFIGRNALAPLAARGYEVHGVGSPRTRAPAGASGGDVAAWHSVDLLDRQAAADLVAAVRPTHLLHLAWYAEHGRYWTSPENLRWVESSLTLMRAFAEHGGTRAVVAGTCAEYDWSTAGPCVEDETPLRPATLYGVCKNALRQVLAAYAAGSGELTVAWGRVFLLYGPHEHADRLVPSVIRAVLAGERAACTHGRQLRDFLQVGDVADAFAALLDSDVEGAVNVASGVPVPIAEVVGTAAGLLGRTDLVDLGAIPTRADDPPELVADVSRLAEEVGWSPSISLREGLERTVAWWRERSPRPAVG